MMGDGADVSVLEAVLAAILVAAALGAAGIVDPAPPPVQAQAAPALAPGELATLTLDLPCDTGVPLAQAVTLILQHDACADDARTALQAYLDGRFAGSRATLTWTNGFGSHGLACATSGCAQQGTHHASLHVALTAFTDPSPDGYNLELRPGQPWPLVTVQQDLPPVAPLPPPPPPPTGLPPSLPPPPPPPTAPLPPLPAPPPVNTLPLYSCIRAPLEDGTHIEGTDLHPDGRTWVQAWRAQAGVPAEAPFGKWRFYRGAMGCPAPDGQDDDAFLVLVTLRPQDLDVHQPLYRLDLVVDHG